MAKQKKIRLFLTRDFWGYGYELWMDEPFAVSGGRIWISDMDSIAKGLPDLGPRLKPGEKCEVRLERVNSEAKS